jgi:hypothetical protein
MYNASTSSGHAIYAAPEHLLDFGFVHCYFPECRKIIWLFILSQHPNARVSWYTLSGPGDYQIFPHMLEN